MHKPDYLPPLMATVDRRSKSNADLAADYRERRMRRVRSIEALGLEPAKNRKMFYEWQNL